MLDKSAVRSMMLNSCNELNPTAISPINAKWDYLTVTAEELEHFAQAIYALGEKDERERIAGKFEEAGWHPYTRFIRDM